MSDTDIATKDDANVDAPGSAQAHDHAVDNAEQPFLEHLIELRSRILRGIGAVFVIFIPFAIFAEDMFTFISAPLVAQLPDGATMIATQVATPFITPFKLAIYSAIFAGVPFLLHQVWAFVSPKICGAFARIKHRTVLRRYGIRFLSSVSVDIRVLHPGRTRRCSHNDRHQPIPRLRTKNVSGIWHRIRNSYRHHAPGVVGHSHRRING